MESPAKCFTSTTAHRFSAIRYVAASSSYFTCVSSVERQRSRNRPKRPGAALCMVNVFRIFLFLVASICVLAFRLSIYIYILYLQRLLWLNSDNNILHINAEFDE